MIRRGFSTTHRHHIEMESTNQLTRWLDTVTYRSIDRLQLTALFGTGAPLFNLYSTVTPYPLQFLFLPWKTSLPRGSPPAIAGPIFPCLKLSSSNTLGPLKPSEKYSMSSAIHKGQMPGLQRRRNPLFLQG